MTETVLVALITCVAGLGGAVFGVIAAKVTANAQTSQTIVQEYFKRRADAFEAVFQAERELELHRDSRGAIENFSSAVDIACISVLPDNALKIMKFKDAVLEHPDDRELIKDTKASAVMAMQEELMVFAKPKIVRNIWRKMCFIDNIRNIFDQLHHR